MQDDTIHTLSARELDRVSGASGEGSLPGPCAPAPGLPSMPPPIPIPSPPGPGELPIPPWPIPGLKILTF